jgi:hypothetical protein
MPWLEAYADRILPMAGYPNVGSLEALVFAESIIEAYTRRVWGQVVPYTAKIRLAAKSLVLPLPSDAVSAASLIGPVDTSGYTLEVSPYGLLAEAGGKPVIFGPGLWVIQGNRGSITVPEPLIRAAALLANYYLGLADSERSRYQQISIGDFSGGMRFFQLPVPEAETLLNTYVGRVEVSV